MFKLCHIFIYTMLNSTFDEQYRHVFDMFQGTECSCNTLWFFASLRTILLCFLFCFSSLQWKWNTLSLWWSTYHTCEPRGQTQVFSTICIWTISSFECFSIIWEKIKSINYKSLNCGIHKKMIGPETCLYFSMWLVAVAMRMKKWVFFQRW